MEPITGHKRYAEVTARLDRINSSAAGLITVLTIASVWGRLRLVALVCLVQAAVIVFNKWVNLRLLRRWSTHSAETLRGIVNMASGVCLGHVLAWPLPTWLWLPFVALAFDPMDPRVGERVVVAFCLSFDVVALVDGVAPLYPLTFTLLALFGLIVTKVRFHVVRDMFRETDQQREELEAAHGRLTREVKARQNAELELRQAQKLEAVGRLASGIAHEINTPVQFASDSVCFLREATEDLLALVDMYRKEHQSLAAGAPLGGVALRTARAENDVGLDRLVEEIPKAVTRAADGLGRVTKIVRAMKEFAHPEQSDMTPTDLNRGLTSTLAIAADEYRLVADVELDTKSLPLVVCHGGEINQVFLNLIVNAAHAIADVVKAGGPRGLIHARTRADGEGVVVAISDTGGGIPDGLRSRIFEPFFTTKEVGRGTGQGLAVARSVVQRHGGTLTFESTVGKGTTFTVRLPIVSPPPDVVVHGPPVKAPSPVEIAFVERPLAPR